LVLLVGTDSIKSAIELMVEILNIPAYVEEEALCA
jgi:hypothetical protein